MKTKAIFSLRLLLLCVFFCCYGNAKSQNSTVSPLPILQDIGQGNAPVSSATLVFKDGKNSKVRLYYHDYLNGFIDVIASNEPDSVQVSFRNFLIVYHAMKGNAPFILLPKDRIVMSLDSAGRLVLETNSPVRNAELNLFNNMYKSEQLDFSFTSLIMELKDFKEKSFARADSVILERHTKKIALLKTYSTNSLLRPEMVKLAEQFLIHKTHFEKYLFITRMGGTVEELKDYYSLLSGYLQNQNRYSYYFPDFRIIAISSFNSGYVASSAMKKDPEGTLPEKNFERNLALVESFFNASLVEPVQYLLISNSNNRKLKNNKGQLLNYASRYPDTDFTKHLKSELAYSESINKYFEGNQLLGQKDASLPLEEVIAKNRGKVIYIDFWASWCVPCLEEMPSSIELQKKYKQMGVEFVYLSVDKNKTAWAKGQQRHPKALQTANSFLLLNDFSAPFAQGLRLQTIPRYILIDKTGKIVNANAPRPSQPDLLEKEITKLLL